MNKKFANLAPICLECDLCYKKRVVSPSVALLSNSHSTADLIGFSSKIQEHLRAMAGKMEVVATSNEAFRPQPWKKFGTALPVGRGASSGFHCFEE